MNVLVSSCLLGVFCRYNGAQYEESGILKLMKEVTLIPVCPEQIGGLHTPRDPAERLYDAVITKSGEDVTQYFRKGAEEVLRLAKLYHCEYAILKERSPSCGKNKIYNGNFENKLITGMGMTAELLEHEGIKVFSEEQVEEFKSCAGIT